MKRIPLALIIAFVFFNLSGLKAQTNNLPQTNSVVRIDDNIDPRMGFVVGHNLVLTILDTQEIDNGLLLSFRKKVAGPRPRVEYSVGRARIIKIDPNHHLALLATNTADAAPLILAGRSSIPNEDFYWYMKTTTSDPKKFHGVDTIFSITTPPEPDNSFRSIPGSPVFDSHNRIVGMATAKCNAGVGWRTCLMSANQLQQFIR